VPIEIFLCDLTHETIIPVWASEKDMLDHYNNDEAFERLKAGEVGGNLIYKYKSMSLALAMPDWILFLASQLKTIARENPDNAMRLMQKSMHFLNSAEIKSGNS
jgi:hypothetical protein